jgi:hypothetical protein
MEVMEAMSTQLNFAGMGAVLGYRYEALPAVMDFLQVPAAERGDLFACFRVMEGEVTRALRERVGRGG